MKKSVVFLLALVSSAVFQLSAISFWEGTAVASSYGEFPQAGLYAACSSFPRNSLVEVSNLENGKSVQVLVTRSLDNPGVFIALSPEAASEIGISMGMVARVKVSLPQNRADNLLKSDSPGRSLDPDLNPQALVNRERSKADSGLSAPLNDNYGPENVDTGISKQPDIIVQKTPERTPEKTPGPGKLSTPSVGLQASATVLPDVIGGQRQLPLKESLSLKASDLPETPLAQKTPLAVEARTDGREGSRVDSRDTGNESAVKPEALSRPTKLQQAPGADPSYALGLPGLEAQTASVKKPEIASVYERSASLPKSGSELKLGLDNPELSPRERPESALTRLSAPDARSASLAKALPEYDASLGPERAETLSSLRLSRPGSGDTSLSLALPGLEASTDTVAESANPIERLVVIRREGLGTALGLADPELYQDETGTASAEERLLAKRNLPSGQELGLLDPELRATEAGELSAEERLLASRKIPGSDEISLSLADPEVGEDLLKPEEGILSAEERLLAGRRESGSGAIALLDPELAAEIKEDASAEVRLSALKRSGPALSASIPDPDTSEISLVMTSENPPPEALVGSTLRPGMKAQEIALSLQGPELPAQAELAAERVGPEINLVERPLPESARDLLGIQKASPELIAMEEKDVTPDSGSQTIQVPDRGPEVVESLRKGAEALAALNVQRLERLSKGIYYVQVGMYRTDLGAVSALKKIGQEYPLSYQEVDDKADPLYKLYVGPIKKDESGIVLYRLKSLGFKDAFVRKGD